MGRVFIVVGLLLLGFGAVFHFAPWLVRWFGRLPGDIRVESDGAKFFLPLTSMALVSVAITFILRLFRK